MRLQLADPGWLLIKDATLRVSGSLDAVVREMAAVLSDEVVRSLCSKLGILSTGFFFVDPNAELTPWFTLDEGHRQGTYRTQYLWVDDNAGKLWSDVVHRLFVHVRMTQRKYAKPKRPDDNRWAVPRTEDFFRHIPKDDGLGYCVDEADRGLRREHAIHYVTLGEMVFTMLAWRSLVAAVSRGEAGAPLDQLKVGLEDGHKAPLACLWCGVDLLNRNRSRGGTDPWVQLRDAWKMLAGPSPSLRSEWDALGVRQSSCEPRSAEFVALTRFAVAAGAINDGEAHQMTCESLNAAIQKNVASFLQHLGLRRGPRTVGDALSAMERYARFPLLPFYLWHALDGAPKCYLVTPVWTSQRYSVRVDDAECRRCRHLGLALNGVSPLRRIDWTVPVALIPNDGIHSSDADPVVVASVVRLMARPLVEGHVYGKAVRECKRRLQIDADASVQKSIRSASEQA